MRHMGLHGAVRDRTFKMTIPDDIAAPEAVQSIDRGSLREDLLAQLDITVTDETTQSKVTKALFK